jgi:hypothetical protein
MPSITLSTSDVTVECGNGSVTVDATSVALDGVEVKGG